MMYQNKNRPVNDKSLMHEVFKKLNFDALVEAVKLDFEFRIALFL